jgi:RNAse (barnase) inhibitor barstar
VSNFAIDLTAVISGQAAPQLYRLDLEMPPTDLEIRVQAAGGQLFRLAGAAMTDKDSLCQEFAKVMNFPSYFGHNWDALSDLLTDLGWLEDDLHYHILLIEQWHLCANPILLDILQETVDFWAEAETPMYVLIHSNIPDIGQFLLVR